MAAVTMSPSDAGELVGQGDHRAAPGLFRVRRGLGPAAYVPADDAPGQLLHHQLGDVPAAVAPHVHDQAVELDLGAQVAVEVGPALPHHVRDVQVAQPPFGQLADRAAPAGHPVLVPQPPLVPQRDHDRSAARAGCGLHRELDGLARGPGQQRPRPAHRVDRLAVHGHQLITGLDRHAGRSQRRAGPRVGRLAGQHPVHHPSARTIPGDVRAQLAHGRAARAESTEEVPAGLDDVGVRGAELGHRLPQHVGEVVRAADPVQQRPVVVQHAVPVHAGQVRGPEVTADDAAHLGVGVPPQRRRVGGEPGPGQVDGHRVVRVMVVLVLGRHHPQLVVVPDDQLGAIAADLEPVEFVGQLGDLALAQVEPLQRGARRVILDARGALAQHAGDRLAQPGQAALDRGQAGVPGLGHGHAHHAAGQAVGVDGDHGPFGRI